MAEARSRQVIIAGGGIAGLTTALAFAMRGYPVRIFERADRLEESGAGIQLSPNATRILDRLGVLSALRLTAVRPTSVILRDAASLAELAGEVAWRRTVGAESAAARSLIEIGVAGAVTAFMHPGFHLVAYPVRGGAALNLVAITGGAAMAESWSGQMDTAVLRRAMGRTAPALRALAGDGEAWTAWPIHTVPAKEPWIAAGGIALVGDAAHAMTPYAAQGAAMAIEDGETLAVRVIGRQGTLASALTAWEKERRSRVSRVARRGAANHRAWHASGLVAKMRNVYLQVHSPERLAKRFDWLYGWEPPSLKV